MGVFLGYLDCVCLWVCIVILYNVIGEFSFSIVCYNDGGINVGCIFFNGVVRKVYIFIRGLDGYCFVCDFCVVVVKDEFVYSYIFFLVVDKEYRECIVFCGVGLVDVFVYYGEVFFLVLLIVYCFLFVKVIV